MPFLGGVLNSGDVLIEGDFKNFRRPPPECPAGMWGANCTQRCDCGADGNSCDNIDGDCICSACWTGPKCAIGESTFLLVCNIHWIMVHLFLSVNVYKVCVFLPSTAVGSDCVRDFLVEENKVGPHTHTLYNIDMS